uniref:Uncharacterized protein n=1 Tax=viral metagenome TaxID=1070528 RepID=A0A6C0LI60_9ZZZZ
MLQITEDTDFDTILKMEYDADDLSKLLECAKIKIIKSDDGRSLFTTDLHDTSVKHYKVRYQSRGMILDELEHKVLSFPGGSHSYFSNIKKETFKDLYNDDKYDIIEARDGTNITLYNFEGILCMGTGRSVDITNYYWSSKKTFAEMFYESAQTNKKFVEDTKLSLKDRSLRWNIPDNYCVTIGFRHHDIHQNLSDPMDIWLVKCIDKNTKTEIDIEQLANLKENKKVIDKIDYNDIIKKCNRSMYEDQEENFYGYIFHYNGSENIPIEFQKVFIPSILYKTLQHFFYSFNKNNEDNLTHHNRYIYSIFRNILYNNTSELNLLYKLNPKYKNFVRDYNSFIDRICSFTSVRIRDNNYGNDEIEIQITFVDSIIQNIKDNDNDVLTDAVATTKLINDYIRNPNNTKVLVDIYLKKLNI